MARLSDKDLVAWFRSGRDLSLLTDEEFGRLKQALKKSKVDERIAALQLQQERQGRVSRLKSEAGEFGGVFPRKQPETIPEIFKGVMRVAAPKSDVAVGVMEGLSRPPREGPAQTEEQRAVAERLVQSKGIGQPDAGRKSIVRSLGKSVMVPATGGLAPDVERQEAVDLRRAIGAVVAALGGTPARLLSDPQIATPGEAEIVGPQGLLSDDLPTPSVPSPRAITLARRFAGLMAGSPTSQALMAAFTPGLLPQTRDAEAQAQQDRENVGRIVANVTGAEFAAGLVKAKNPRQYAEDNALDILLLGAEATPLGVAGMAFGPLRRAASKKFAKTVLEGSEADVARLFNQLGDVADETAKAADLVRSSGGENAALADRILGVSKRAEKLRADKDKWGVEGAQNLYRQVRKGQEAVTDKPPRLGPEASEDVLTRAGRRKWTAGEFANRLSTSAMGGTLGAMASSQDDNHPIWLGTSTIATAAGVGFLLGGSRQKLLKPGGLLSGKINFEARFDRAARLFFPDRLVEQGPYAARWRLAGMAAGGTTGGLVGGLGNEQDFSPGGAAAGALIMAAVGSIGGTQLREAMRASGVRYFNPYREYQRLMNEAGTLARLPAQLADRRATFRAIRAQQAEINDLAGEFDKLLQPERDAIDRVFRGQASPMSLPEDHRNLAAAFRVTFDEMALTAVEEGIVTGKLAERYVDNLGSYVPRLYLKFEKNDPLFDVANYLYKHGTSLRAAGKRDWIKHRRFVPKKIRERWGELSSEFEKADPGYLLRKRAVPMAADLEIRRYAMRIASSDMTMDDALLSAIKKGDVEDAVMFAAKDGRDHVEFGGREYRQMPSDRRLGALSGKMVLADVAYDYENFHDVFNTGFSLLTESTNLFKRAKIAWNPATLIRNALGQMILNHVVGGVRPTRWDVYAPAWREFFGKGELYVEARRAGLFGAEWFGGEIQPLLGKRIADAEGTNRSIFKIFSDIAQDSSLDKLSPVAYARKMEKIHQGTDQFNKMAMYYHARRNLGLGVKEAVDWTENIVFNYQNVPRWINLVRRSPFGVPFISFSYKAIPRALESAIAIGDPKKMARFWMYPAAFAAINEGSFNVLGGPEEFGLQEGPVGALKRAGANMLGMGFGIKNLWGSAPYTNYLPDYTGPAQILLWSRDEFDRPIAFDATFHLPWGQMGEMAEGNIGRALREIGIALPAQLEPTGPWMNVATAMLAQRDAFTGQPVFTPGTPPGDRPIALLSFLSRTFGPPLGPGGWEWNALDRALKHDVLADPNVPTVLQAAARQLAARSRPVIPRLKLFNEIRQQQQLVAQLKGERTKGVKYRGAGLRFLQGRTRGIEEEEARLKKMRDRYRKLPAVPKVFEDQVRRLTKQRGQDAKEILRQLRQGPSGE